MRHLGPAGLSNVGLQPDPRLPKAGTLGLRSMKSDAHVIGFHDLTFFRPKGRNSARQKPRPL